MATSVRRHRRHAGATVKIWLRIIRSRRALSAALAPLLACSVVVSAFSGWAHARVASGPALGGEVRAVLDQPSVRVRLADRLTAEVIKLNPTLSVQQAEVHTAALDVVSSSAFGDLVEIAVDALRAEIVDEHAPGAQDRLDGTYQLALELLTTLSPSVAGRLPADAQTELVDLGDHSGIRRALHDADTLATLFIPSLMIDLLIAAAVMTSTGFSRRGMWLVSFGVVGGGALVIGATALVRAVLARSFAATDQASGRTAVRVVTNPLLGSGVRLVVAGGVCGAALAIQVAVRRYPRRAVASFAMVSLLVSISLVAVTVRSALATRPGRAACLGHRELCDRRFDEVTLAGTHNSMNSSAAGYTLPEQSGDIAAQLESGIRALLIDTHYGRRSVDGFVWTDIDLDGPDRAKYVDEFGADRVAEVEALRARAAPPAAKGELYLCHNLCELGATPYLDALHVVRHFLVTHPAEIVVLFVQDESAPSDNITAIERAGLARMTIEHRDGDTWSTLRELVRTNKRLLVLAENDGGTAPFYHVGFDLYQETSFDVTSTDAFTCTLNRGTVNSPLFLLNHWIEQHVASESQAAIVNEREFLLQRARQCATERRMVPNIIAVNFSDVGDVMKVVDELNGVSSGL